jgi:hypothetical protein
MAQTFRKLHTGTVEQASERLYATGGLPLILVGIATVLLFFADNSVVRTEPLLVVLLIALFVVGSVVSSVANAAVRARYLEASATSIIEFVQGSLQDIIKRTEPLPYDLVRWRLEQIVDQLKRIEGKDRDNLSPM